VGDAPGLARVLDHREMVEQGSKARLPVEHGSGKAHPGNSQSGGPWNHPSRNPLIAVNPSSLPWSKA